MKARDIMSKSVVSLSSNDTIERAATLMKEYDIGSVPVCDSDKVIGIVTDRDIALRAVSSSSHTSSDSVKNIMTTNPVTASPDMSLEDLSRIMSQQQIRRIPIVENQRLVGVVSLGDLATEPQADQKAGHSLSDISQPGTQNY
ncbi:CBS domain-containing protein [Clostridium zeae]|uniref:CBS domain-containing protein n=1 Tax=Clostridium zeae TaxID=2759022 RepID=A0ABQ1EDQ6_9CLOT|nr:CBS domain-containing protein [Clostridium zeae]GFZ32891.1 CBS domain-containing protein [Clostridium zeae]